MDATKTDNDALVNEYINVLLKKYNDATLEIVNFQTRINLANREKEQFLKSIEEKENDIEDLKTEIQSLRNRKPLEPEVKEVEVIKEVIKEVVKEGEQDKKLVAENEYLKKALNDLEKKVISLKNRK